MEGKRTTVYVDRALLESARLTNINCSELLNDALRAALRVPSEREKLLKRRAQLAAELAILDRELGQIEEREARKREAAAAENRKIEPFRKYYLERVSRGWPTERRQAWVHATALKLGYEVSELEGLLQSPGRPETSPGRPEGTPPKKQLEKDVFTQLGREKRRKKGAREVPA